MKDDFSIERAMPLFDSDKFRRAGIEAILAKYKLDSESGSKGSGDLTDAERAMLGARSMRRPADAKVIYMAYQPAIDRYRRQRETTKLEVGRFM